MMPLRDNHPAILLSAELYLNSSKKVQNCFFDHYTHFIRDDIQVPTALMMQFMCSVLCPRRLVQ